MRKVIKNCTLLLVLCFMSYLSDSCSRDGIIDKPISIDTTKKSSSDAISQKDTIRHIIYKYLMEDIPVTEKNYQNAFIGNIINEDKSTVSHLFPLKNVEFNEIEVSLLYNGELFYQKFIPSWNNTNHFFKSLPQISTQNKVISSSKESFDSYRALHLFSESNYALALDSIILQKSDKYNNKYKRKLYLYSLTQENVSITMDYPGENGLINNKMRDGIRYDYISSITYGKRAFLIIDSPKSDIQELINKEIHLETLSSTEKYEIERTKAYIITFSQDCTPTVLFGNGTIIRELQKRFNSQTICPLFFNLNSLETNSLRKLTHTVNMK